MFDSDLKTRNILLIFFLTSGALLWILSYTLVSDQLYFDLYGEQMAYQRVVSFVEQQKKWEWLGYVFLPIIYLVKFVLIASVLLMGLFLANITIQFDKVFRIVVEAEFIFLVPTLIKWVWFGFIDRDYSIMDLTNFAPLSLENILSVSESTPWLSPLFKSISLFEVVYWIWLAYGLKMSLKTKFSRSMELVAASYGSAWVVWQVFVIFLFINFSA